MVTVFDDLLGRTLKAENASFVNAKLKSACAGRTIFKKKNNFVKCSHIGILSNLYP